MIFPRQDFVLKDDIARPDRPWGPPSLLHTGYRMLAGGKAAGAWR